MLTLHWTHSWSVINTNNCPIYSDMIMSVIMHDRVCVWGGQIYIFSRQIKVCVPICSLLWYIEFICSEKTTKFYEIFTLLLSYVVPVKSKMKISQNFVAFSEYMNFICLSTLTWRSDVIVQCTHKKYITYFLYLNGACWSDVLGLN